MGRGEGRVLFIGESLEDAALVEEALSGCRGASFSVDHAEDLSSGLDMLEKMPYGLLILEALPPHGPKSRPERSIARTYPDLPVILLVEEGGAEPAPGIPERCGRSLHISRSEIREGLLDRLVYLAIEHGETLAGTRRVEKRFLGFLEENPDALLLVGQNGEILFLNEAARGFFGFPGKDVGDKFGFELPGKEGAELTVRTDPLGEVKLGSMRSDPMVFEGRDVSLVTIRNITDQRKAQARLENIRRVESLQILAGGVALKFNNILTGVIGNISVCKNLCRTEDPIHPRLEKSEEACREAERLIRKLLLFSSGGEPVRKRESPRDLLEEYVALGLGDFSGRVQWDIQEDLWVFDVDREQIGTAIMNITRNAVQAMEGEGVLRVEAANRKIAGQNRYKLPQGNYVAVTFDDEGCGMDPETMERLFDPFFSTRKGMEGLGLSIALSVVEGHKGAIHVDSEPGLGTTATILLPAAGQVMTGEGTAVFEPRTGTPRPVEEKPAEEKKPHVLLMDDEDFIRDAVSQMLRHLGCSVRAVSEGRAAVQAFKEAAEQNAPFDLVILDLVIPAGMGGRETLEELRMMDPQVVAVGSCGYSGDSILSEYKKFGFTAAMPKPYSMDELRKVLEGVLSAGKAP